MLKFYHNFLDDAAGTENENEIENAQYPCSAEAINSNTTSNRSTKLLIKSLIYRPIAMEYFVCISGKIRNRQTRKSSYR